MLSYVICDFLKCLSVNFLQKTINHFKRLTCREMKRGDVHTFTSIVVHVLKLSLQTVILGDGP